MIPQISSLVLFISCTWYLEGQIKKKSHWNLSLPLLWFKWTQTFICTCYSCSSESLQKLQTFSTDVTIMLLWICLALIIMWLKYISWQPWYKWSEIPARVFTCHWLGEDVCGITHPHWITSDELHGAILCIFSRFKSRSLLQLLSRTLWSSRRSFVNYETFHRRADNGWLFISARSVPFRNVERCQVAT